MGFKDSDLKLQSHDDIIFWIYKDETIKEIITKYILKGNTHFEMRRQIYLKRVLDDSNDSLIDNASWDYCRFNINKYYLLLENWKELLKRYKKNSLILKKDINEIKKKRRNLRIGLIKTTYQYRKYLKNNEIHFYILKKIPEDTIINSKGMF